MACDPALDEESAANLDETTLLMYPAGSYSGMDSGKLYQNDLLYIRSAIWDNEDPDSYTNVLSLYAANTYTP